MEKQKALEMLDLIYKELLCYINEESVNEYYKPTLDYAKELIINDINDKEK